MRNTLHFHFSAHTTFNSKNRKLNSTVRTPRVITKKTIFQVRICKFEITTVSALIGLNENKLKEYLQNHITSPQQPSLCILS